MHVKASNEPGTNHMRVKNLKVMNATDTLLISRSKKSCGTFSFDVIFFRVVLENFQKQLMNQWSKIQTPEMNELHNDQQN